jgi:hypothetical protein
MIGLVDTGSQLLNDICIKLCNALEDSILVYNAVKYANLIEYPNGSKYALIISENKKYYDVIMSTLTQEEKNLIQWIGSDWFPDSPAPSEE